MKLSKFTVDGVTQVGAYLDSLRQDDTLGPPFDLLEDPGLVEVLDVNIDVEQSIRFESRLHCAAYLDEMLGQIGPELEQDVGLWTWLTVLYFDQVCPISSDGRRKVL